MNSLLIRNMSDAELIEQRQSLKYKLWQHIELRPSHMLNDSYVQHLEQQIEFINAILDYRKIAA